MLNTCILIGRLGKDPETRYTDGGTAVSNFSLATEESYKDRSGERQKRTEWHRVVAWGKLAEIAQQYLKKGALVYVEGRIESGEYEKNGEKVRTFQIVANVLRMLGDRGEGRNGDSAQSRTASSKSAEAAVITDDDIPF
jgi:single-strand DNA-binding protein